MQQKFRIEGVDELKAELKAINFEDGLKDANYAAGMLVVDQADSRARALGRMQAKAAGSLRAGRANAKATVTIGGVSTPFALGAEFGSNQFRQFAPWRGSGSRAGYFLWPAVRASGERIVSLYEDAVVKLTARAFPD